MAAILASNGFVEMSTKTHFSLPDVQSMAIAGIHRLFDGMKRDHDYWTNQWVLMDNGLWMETERTFYEWQDDDEVFVIHLFPDEVYMHFKLLPHGIRYKESYGHDGYFIQGCSVPYLNESL